MLFETRIAGEEPVRAEREQRSVAQHFLERDGGCPSFS